mgnify:CR=1 FL=1|tara:strand:+ start:724 stop:924 length:201 start_codon:yes stop_codon:yes gene_type:complete
MKNDYKRYQFSINVRTNHDPRKAIFEIVDQLKGIIPVLSIDYKLIEERDTNLEHHGGHNDSSELET